MAISRQSSHVRSFSWPSEASHPSDTSIERLMLRLRNSNAGPNPFLASSICQDLHDIEALYQRVNNSIQCPLNERVLSLDKNRCQVEEALEGSLTLLDAISSAMDVLSLMKDSILELESSIRRKSRVEETHIGAYMTSRKKIQKMANKCLQNLHNFGSEKDANHLVPILRRLSDAQTVSVSALKSVVVYLSSKPKGTGHSLVAKLMQSKRVSSEKQGETSELEKVDQALLAFEAKMSITNCETAHNLLKQLEALQLTVQGIEPCLESVSRSLLKTRVSLLNVLSH